MAINWADTGAGMFNLGANWYGADQQKRADEKRLAAARGPLYESQLASAGNLQAQAGGVTPQAEFDAMRGLVQPGRAADQASLMRQLQAKGLMGVSNYTGASPTAPTGVGTPQGQSWTPGMLTNPHMAALFAAQQGADARMAAGAIGSSRAEQSRLLNESRAQSGAATGSQQRGMAPYAPGSGVSAAGKSAMPGLLGGLGGLLKNTGMFSGIAKGIGDLLGDSFGGGTYNTPGSSWLGRDDWRSESWI